MTNKYTPAPWAWNKQGNRMFQYTGNPTGAIAICDIVRTPNYKANRHLIAAAPDLLEALEELVMLVDDIRTGDYKPDSFTTQPGKVAIQKAKENK